MTAREAARVSLFDTLASSLIATIPPITDRSTQSSSDSRRTTHDVRPLCVSRAREISASSTVPRFHDSPVPRFRARSTPILSPNRTNLFPSRQPFLLFVFFTVIPRVLSTMRPELTVVSACLRSS